VAVSLSIKNEINENFFLLQEKKKVIRAK
jgi:hypothetical protein